MTIADISLLFDMMLAILLAAMIFYAVRLNKRIAVLRDGEGALQKMIGQFSESSLVAQETARQLKSAGTEAEFGVKAAIAKAMALRNDLEVMLDQADLLVAKMDDDRYRVPPAPANNGPGMPAYRTNDRSAGPAAELTRRAPSRPEPSRQEPSRQEASRPTPFRQESPRPAGNVQPFSPPVRSADEVVRATAKTSSAPLQPRSEAERHLLDAIRAAKEGVA